MLLDPIYCLDMNFQSFQKAMSASKPCPTQRATDTWDCRSAACVIDRHLPGFGFILIPSHRFSGPPASTPLAEFILPAQRDTAARSCELVEGLEGASQTPAVRRPGKKI